MVNWGATLGLAVGGIMTGINTYKAYKEGWDVGDSFQSCFTGYSMQKKDFDASRMVFTIPALTGGAASWIARKTKFNTMTPKGWNV